MARVTVEDCIEEVPNRFELVILSSQRARELFSGAIPCVDRDNDKNTVVSLREIGSRSVSIDRLREACSAVYRRQTEAFESQKSNKISEKQDPQSLMTKDFAHESDYEEAELEKEFLMIQESSKLFKDNR